MFRVNGMCLFHQKKRSKVDNNLSIKRKLILFAYIASQRMLVFFLAFFFGGFTWSDDILNFIVYFIRNTAFIWTKIYPAWSGSRLLQPRSRSRETSRSPYKHNCENNSTLSTSRDPGIPGHPVIPGLYKQALKLVPRKPKMLKPSAKSTMGMTILSIASHTCSRLI